MCQAAEDSWAEYARVYMTAIRAKFFAAQEKLDAKQPKTLNAAGSNNAEAENKIAEAAAAPSAMPLLVREDTAFTG